MCDRLCAEMVRVLLLTSCVGFLAMTCWMKIFVAQFISVVFMVLFLVVHPYRRGFHRTLQLLSMFAPVVALTWSLAGGWEKWYKEFLDDPTTVEEALAYDTTVVVIMHAVVLVVPLAMSLFTMFSTLFFWLRAKRTTTEDTRETAAAEKKVKAAKEQGAEKRKQHARRKWDVASP